MTLDDMTKEHIRRYNITQYLWCVLMKWHDLVRYMICDVMIWHDMIIITYDYGYDNDYYPDYDYDYDMIMNVIMIWLWYYWHGIALYHMMYMIFDICYML